jgi:hypothetical protein
VKRLPTSAGGGEREKKKKAQSIQPAIHWQPARNDCRLIVTKSDTTQVNRGPTPGRQPGVQFWDLTACGPGQGIDDLFFHPVSDGRQGGKQPMGRGGGCMNIHHLDFARKHD